MTTIQKCILKSPLKFGNPNNKNSDTILMECGRSKACGNTANSSRTLRSKRMCGSLG